MMLPNGRDIGGHRTRAGQVVRSGVLLRSAAPVTPEHAQALTALQVRTAIDLRTAAERERRPATLPQGVAAIAADVLADEPDTGPASLGAIARAALAGDAAPPSAAELDAIFVAGYESFITLDSARAATSLTIRHLARAQIGATVLHCTAGKDRTGWIVATVLLTLDVSWDDVVADYLRSGPAVLALFAPYRDRVARDGGDLAALERAISVFPHYLEAAHAAALRRYGSWDGYLAGGLGLADEELTGLRDRLLESGRPTAS